jgi:hypothetical protein
MSLNPPRSESQLVDLYGRENVRVHQNRLQVQEEHFQQPGGRILEWVEADMALPPADPTEEPTAQVVDQEDLVSESDYKEALEDAEDEDDEDEG